MTMPSSYQLLFDSLQDAVFFFDDGGRMVDANAAASLQLGYTREELIGMHVSAIAARSDFDMGQALARLEGRDRVSYQTANRRKDGSNVPVDLHIHVVYNGSARRIVCVARDLTEQHAADRMRDRLERRYRLLVDNLPGMAVMLYDRDLRFVMVGGQALLPGFEPERLEGNLLYDVIPHEFAQLVEGNMRAAFERRAVSLELPFEGGGWYHYDYRPVYDENGEIELCMILAQDVTERRQREEELQRRNEELVRFTYAVSHDLKSPLVTIQSFLGYLEQDIARGDREASSRDFAFLRTAADRMGRLLSEILEFSRIGRKVNPSEHVPARALVDEALVLIGGRVADRGITVEIGPMPVELYGDRVRLVEVLQNLLDNAVKFSTGVAGARVAVGVEVVDGEPVVFVQDNGVGIDPRHKDKLFGLFEKLRPEYEGTGIGLALVKRVLDVHGGRVWVESAGEGQGTTVRFTLPGSRFLPGDR